MCPRRYETQWVVIMASVAQKHAEAQAAARGAQETLHQVGVWEGLSLLPWLGRGLPDASNSNQGLYNSAVSMHLPGKQGVGNAIHSGIPMVHRPIPFSLQPTLPTHSQGFFSELWRKQNGRVPQLMLLQQTLGGGALTSGPNPLTSATGGDMATLDEDVAGLGDLGCGDGRRVGAATAGLQVAVAKTYLQAHWFSVQLRTFHARCVSWHLQGRCGWCLAAFCGVRKACTAFLEALPPGDTRQKASNHVLLLMQALTQLPGACLRCHFACARVPQRYVD
jgi:hypothetical protein